MTKLQKLYSSIESLKELGVKLPAELIEKTNRVEEDIIKNEVIPILAKEITPIILQIQRELVLVIDYIPDEPLQVRLTRKRSLKLTEEEEKIFEKVERNRKETSYTITPHTKSKKTNLNVIFADGTVISNHFASDTLLQTIDRIGPEKVKKLQLIQGGIDLVVVEEDDFYRQNKINNGLWLNTHSSTAQKKKQMDEISERLGVGLKVEIV